MSQTHQSMWTSGTFRSKGSESCDSKNTSCRRKEWVWLDTSKNLKLVVEHVETLHTFQLLLILYCAHFSHASIAIHIKKYNAANAQLMFCRLYLFVVLVRRIKIMVWIITSQVGILTLNIHCCSFHSKSGMKQMLLGKVLQKILENL